MPGAAEGTEAVPPLPLKQKIAMLLPHLDERARRLYLAAEARALGHGGVTEVAKLSGYSRATIQRGLDDLEEEPLPGDRTRRPGGGRRPLRETEPGLVDALKLLVDPGTRGDPMSPLLYSSKSTEHLAEALRADGFNVSADTVGRLLQEEGFSLQANAKTREGNQHEDRDAQFQYLNQQVRDHQSQGQPVVSVDAKKKELVGNYSNGGREYEPVEQPVETEVHDFRKPGPESKVTPYGIYDVGRNEGWVNVGCDHDTSAFAVASIRTWWDSLGRESYPEAKKLLICADGGGSNGSRVRLWKAELAKFAAETGLTVTVCHLPPGTSKWNKIEHRLFSNITMNWRARPLTSLNVIVNCIAATTTKTGLKVSASVDRSVYPLKVKVSNKEMAALPLSRHEFHGEWNYTLTPATKET